MRVRVPIEKHSTANEHQQKMMKLYKKFNAQHSKRYNDISDEEDENEGEEPHEDDLSDLQILGVKKADHPCINEVLVEKQTCGLGNKPCEHEIYGIPCKDAFFVVESFNSFEFENQLSACWSLKWELVGLKLRIVGTLANFLKIVIFSPTLAVTATETISKAENSVSRLVHVSF